MEGDQMNIGIFTDTYAPEINGVAMSIRWFRTALEKAGHRTFVFAPSQNHDFREEKKERIWRFPSVAFYGYKQVRFVLPFVHASAIPPVPFDIIHTHTPGTLGLRGLAYARAHGIPVIHTYHTFFEAYVRYAHLPNVIVKPLARILSRVLLSRHDAVIAPSRGMKKILEAYGVEIPIHVLPTGIDPARIARLSMKPSGKSFFAEYGIDPKRHKILITASRLGYEKNIPFLLDAFRRIKAEVPSAKFVVVGDGPARESLIQETERLGLASDVVFAGFLPHETLFPLYRAAKLFVFASRTETQGLVILEAMATGLPVVAVHAMGVEDALEDGVGGVLVPEDSAVFARETISLLRSASRYRKAQQETTKKAGRYSMRASSRKLLSLYQNTILWKRQNEVH